MESKFGTSKQELAQVGRLEPPPLYPQLEVCPEPLDVSQAANELVCIEEELVTYFNNSADFVSRPKRKTLVEERYALDKEPKATLNNLASNSLLPDELLKAKARIVSEKVPAIFEEVVEDEEKQEDEEEEEEAEDEEDDEVEAGGDYGETYFDNGEENEDNDDDGDDGPQC